jgi:hypothetical protein
MGMGLALHSVSDQNIERILASPPLIWRLLARDDPEVYREFVGNQGRGLFARLFGKGKPEPVPEVPDLELVEGENNEGDLDKSWHAIHYCLNKTNEAAEPPMDFIMDGGRTAGDIDVGFGPARLVDSGAVKEIDRRISGVTPEQLRERYDPAEMDRLEIYPGIWQRDGDEGFEYVAEYFESLKRFVDHCARHDLGMAVFLC